MIDRDSAPFKSVAAWLGAVLIVLCAILAVYSSKAISAEKQMSVSLEDYLGCWITIEPTALTIETDHNKPDGYIVGSSP